MKKLRRVLALIGAILLIGMYLATMLLAIFGNADSKGWLMASIVMLCHTAGRKGVFRQKSERSLPQGRG